MKGLDGSTITQEQMDDYYRDIREFEEYMQSIRPDEFLLDEDTYDAEMREWHMKNHCDKPNMPGYIRANND